MKRGLRRPFGLGNANTLTITTRVRKLDPMKRGLRLICLFFTTSGIRAFVRKLDPMKRGLRLYTAMIGHYFLNKKQE